PASAGSLRLRRGARRGRASRYRPNRQHSSLNSPSSKITKNVLPLREQVFRDFRYTTGITRRTPVDASGVRQHQPQPLLAVLQGVTTMSKQPAGVSAPARERA